MACYVCQSETLPYFTKNFHGEYGLSIVEYWKCNECGFVFSKTHADMSREEWERLNSAVHKSYQGTDFAKDDPKWLTRLNAQSAIITNLARSGLISSSLPWVDHACGDGKLADMLDENGYRTLKYDPYMGNAYSSYLREEDLVSNRYGNVISTSSFEHFLSLEPIEQIMSLVDQEGVLSLHTLVREEIPADPTWFYLFPVHVAFHTNRSMEILFEKFKFNASIYHLPSTMWFWFKGEIHQIKNYVDEYNHREKDELFFKSGFMDYWK